jgi:type II secretory pathway pseudopilin PulG
MSVRVQGGFTYLMLLWWVAISGVMLMALSHSWVMESRREREAELVYRGEQIRAALVAYAKVPVTTGLSPYPRRLEDLLEDQRSGKLVRHLRQVWRDPITNSPTWGLLKDRDGIRGVYSLSRQVPIKAPDGVRSYRQWRFEAESSGAPEPPNSVASGPLLGSVNPLAVSSIQP